MTYHLSNASDETVCAYYGDVVNEKPPPIVHSQITMLFMSCLAGFVCGGLTVGVLAACHATPWVMGGVGGFAFLVGSTGAYLYFHEDREDAEIKLESYKIWDGLSKDDRYAITNRVKNYQVDQKPLNDCEPCHWDLN